MWREVACALLAISALARGSLGLNRNCVISEEWEEFDVHSLFEYTLARLYGVSMALIEGCENFSSVLEVYKAAKTANSYD